MRNISKWAAAAAFVALTGAAQAGLAVNGDGTVTDTATNLIWLQDWNVNGEQNWVTQKAWAENLSFANSSDWALPSIDDYNALFAAYGNPTSLIEFTNVQSGSYWSGTEYSVSPIFVAWVFRTSNGVEDRGDKSFGLYGVAVRQGDVTASVPEPGTLALAGLALAGIAASRRRKQ